MSRNINRIRKILKKYGLESKNIEYSNKGDKGWSVQTTVGEVFVGYNIEELISQMTFYMDNLWETSIFNEKNSNNNHLF